MSGIQMALLTEELAQGNEQHTLRFSYELLDQMTHLKMGCKSATFQTTWNMILRALAPLMIILDPDALW